MSESYNIIFSFFREEFGGEIEICSLYEQFFFFKQLGRERLTALVWTNTAFFFFMKVQEECTRIRALWTRFSYYISFSES